jgi:hypothetical protein
MVHHADPPRHHTRAALRFGAVTSCLALAAFFTGEAWLLPRWLACTPSGLGLSFLRHIDKVVKRGVSLNEAVHAVYIYLYPSDCQTKQAEGCPRVQLLFFFLFFIICLFDKAKL